MAPYVMPDDIRAAVTRDPDKVAGTAASMDDLLLALAAADAQAEVDARLRGRYTVPFPEPIPGLVRSITVDIAAWLATLAYRQHKDLEPTDPVSLRYARAQALLKQIANGDADLDTGGGGATTSAGGGVGAPINPYEGNLVTPADFGLGRGGYRWWR